MTRISPDSKTSAVAAGCFAGGSRSRKAEQIFLAAKEVFMEVGYSATSMDAVAARAGVSKATIYVHFENKRALFEAIVRRRADSMFANFRLPNKVTDLRQCLTSLANSYVGMILSPEALSMYRAVLAEAAQQPDIGDAFYQAGPAFARKRVGEFLLQLSDRGYLSLTDEQAHRLSDLFLSMLANDLHVRALLGHPPDAKRIEANIDMAVDLVMARFS